MCAWFDAIRQGHEEILGALARLEAADAAALPAEVEAFLDFERSRLRVLMRDEEAQLGPLLDRHLPAEAASSSTLRSEHETIRAVVDDLREARRRLGSSPDAEADVASAIADLGLLIRDHIHKEGGVLQPLLEVLSQGGRRA